MKSRITIKHNTGNLLIIIILEQFIVIAILRLKRLKTFNDKKNITLL